MTKTIFVSAAILVALALPASAGTAPTASKVSPETIAASCDALGAEGETLASGCRNIETGAAITCDANGQCKDYFADPRYSKIKAILDAAKKQQAPVWQ